MGRFYTFPDFDEQLVLTKDEAIELRKIFHDMADRIMLLENLINADKLMDKIKQKAKK